MDIYQDWSGPVKPLLGGLRRLKIELSDDLLKFAVVSPKYQDYIMLESLCICVCPVMHRNGTGEDNILYLDFSSVYLVRFTYFYSRTNHTIQLA